MQVQVLAHCLMRDFELIFRVLGHSHSSHTFRVINVASRVYTLAINSRRFTWFTAVLKLSVRFMWNPLLTDLLLSIFEF